MTNNGKIQGIIKDLLYKVFPFPQEMSFPVFSASFLFSVYFYSSFVSSDDTDLPPQSQEPQTCASHHWRPGSSSTQTAAGRQRRGSRGRVVVVVTGWHGAAWCGIMGRTGSPRDFEHDDVCQHTPVETHKTDV